MSRPPAVAKHMNDLEVFFRGQEWQWGDGQTFDASRAVNSLRRYVAKLERNQADGLRVPEWVVIQSVRYGFYRRSYALEMTCDHLRDAWQHLSEDTRIVIRRDLDEAIDDSHRFSGVSDDGYGLRILYKLRDELQAKDEA